MQHSSTRHDQTDHTGALPSLSYLECLNDLSRELQHAMGFLGENSLSSFEQSVSKQLTLCSRLSGLAAHHPLHDSSTSAAGQRNGTSDLVRRIAEAQAHLVQLNRNYSALLRHQGRTVQMFARLSQGYAGLPGNGCAPASDPVRTWSAQS
jgi:hypothetical protein